MQKNSDVSTFKSHQASREITETNLLNMDNYLYTEFNVQQLCVLKIHIFGIIPDKQLFTVIFELLGAASDTTGTTLLWTILYLTQHPEIQEKCREEIKKVVTFNV